MENTDYEYANPGFIVNSVPGFPDAPPDWNRDEAISIACSAGIEMNEARWDIIRALQAYYVKHQKIRIRALSDALDEKFHYLGGKRYLLAQFPGGVITLGCRIAGLSVPAGSQDFAYGTVR